MQAKFLVSECKENDPVTFWITGYTKSNSFKFCKRESTVQKEKGLKKIEFEVSAGDERLLLSKLGQTEFFETLGINSVSKGISFGSVSTSLPETSAK